MKITGIELGCKKTGEVNGESAEDCCLFLFRTPVVFVSGGANRLCRGSSVIMFTAGKKQYFRAPEGKLLRYDMVTFRPSSGDKQYAASMNIPFDTPVELNDDFVIASAIKSMKVRFGITGRRNAEFMELAMRMILICIGDMCSAEPDMLVSQSVPKYSALKRLRESIYSEPMRERTVDEMCAELGVGRTYFHRIYLSAFGVTCRQDIIESRLIYAENLLLNTRLSVSAVAEKCGYESDSYFMRQFRQHRGCTPTEFRRRSENK